MQQYLDMLKYVKENGHRKQNRTGIDTFAVFSYVIHHDLQNGFPLLTTKKMFTKGIIEELLSFLRGDTNTKLLEEKGVNIWKGNTSREFLDNLGLNYLPEGEMGCSYAHQWRNFGGKHKLVPETKNNIGFDQVKDVYNKLNNNPFDRRMIISGWCPNQLKYMALPPCHMIYTFYYNPENHSVNCVLLQRSCDGFLGVCFNLASLALLTHIMAKSANMNPGEISWHGVDVHIYENHIDQVNEQLNRSPFQLPTLDIKRNIESMEDIENLKIDDFEIQNYKFHPQIKAEMAV